jgi:hypothetical protein
VLTASIHILYGILALIANDTVWHPIHSAQKFPISFVCFAS